MPLRTEHERRIADFSLNRLRRHFRIHDLADDEVDLTPTAPLLSAEAKEEFLAEHIVFARGQRLLVRSREATGEVLGWRYPDNFDEEPELRVSQEDAVRAAEEEVDLPPDAYLDCVELQERGAKMIIFSVTWRREIDGLPVEDDFIRAKVNPYTGKVISVQMDWTADHEPTTSGSVDLDQIWIQGLNHLQQLFDVRDDVSIPDPQSVWVRTHRTGRRPILKRGWAVRSEDDSIHPGAWAQVIVDENGELLASDRCA